MEFSDLDFTECPQIPQVLPSLVCRESAERPEGEEIFKMPTWNCFCCRDTGIVRYHLAKRVIRGYDPNRDTNPICQRCNLGKKWTHLKGNIDMQLTKDICEKLDRWDRQNWEETNQQLFENFQKNKEFIDASCVQIATSKTLRQRARTPSEQSYAQYKHELERSDRYEFVQGGKMPKRKKSTNQSESLFNTGTYASQMNDHKTVEEYENAWDKLQQHELRSQELQNKTKVLEAKQSLEERVNNSNESELQDTSELTPLEERDRLRLERQIERAFYEAGKALIELRDRRLYRSTHKTFEAYCKDRFNYNQSRSYQLMYAAGVVDNLKKVSQGVELLPTSERQVRPLADLEPDLQQECWEQAVKSAGGKVPSGRLVADIVQRVMERTKIPNPFRVREVCQIIPKDNPELRGKADCWCFVKEIYESSCAVIAWDGEYILRIDHLKSLNFLDDGCHFIQLLHNRVTSIRSCGRDLEEAATGFLKQLGQIRRHYLTDLEEAILGLIEQKYLSAPNE